MQKLYIHPLPIRIWHWVNASGFVALILTGLQIRYVGLIDVMSFEVAVNLHNWIGFILIGNFFVWLLYYLFSDKIRVYHPELSPAKYFRESFRQLQYYGYGIFKGAPNPHHVSAYPIVKRISRRGILRVARNLLVGGGLSACADLDLVRIFPLRPRIPGYAGPYPHGALQGDVNRV
jgi:Ni,Fe-hydrogenase I cytochrome b subunit